MRDVVYCLAADPPNNAVELRYSLRTLSNLPHRKVYIVGGRPDWVRNITHVPFPDHPGGKWWTLMHKVAFAAAHRELTDVVYMMGDDFYITQPVEIDGPMYTDTLAHRAEVIFSHRRPTSLYGAVFRDTERVLRAAGVADSKNFQLHVPQVLERSALPLDVVLASPTPLGAPTLAANLGSLNPVQIPTDPKPRTSAELEEWKRSGLGWLSSTDKTFESSGMRELLDGLFPDPSPYERRRP